MKLYFKKHEKAHEFFLKREYNLLCTSCIHESIAKISKQIFFFNNDILKTCPDIDKDFVFGIKFVSKYWKKR